MVDRVERQASKQETIAVRILCGWCLSAYSGSRTDWMVKKRSGMRRPQFDFLMYAIEVG